MLSDSKVRTLKPKDKLYKVADERGLVLLVMPNGSKLWRFRYRIDGKEQMLSLGVYPDITLADARARRDEMRRQVALGQNPAVQRKIEQVAKANTFQAIALEWYQKFSAQWVPAHATRVWARMEKDVIPWLGSRPIAEITAPEILTIARRIEGRGALETAHRVIWSIGQVMRYAVATGRAEMDPTASLRGALPSHRTKKHMAAPTHPRQVGEILRALDAFKGSLQVGVALRLLPLLFCRPGELRQMKWDQIDWDKAEWRFIASKTRVEHLVPLSRQAIALLREVQPLTGRGVYVFEGRPGRPISDAAINAALRRMGFDTQREITGHGWRAVARTLLAEELNYRPEVIEHQLAHAVPDALGRAYNRTKYLADRKKMMQEWADYLEGLKRLPVIEKGSS
jgi:integrase